VMLNFDLMVVKYFIRLLVLPFEVTLFY